MFCSVLLADDDSLDVSVSLAVRVEVRDLGEEWLCLVLLADIVFYGLSAAVVRAIRVDVG